MPYAAGLALRRKPERVRGRVVRGLPRWARPGHVQNASLIWLRAQLLEEVCQLVTRLHEHRRGIPMGTDQEVFDVLPVAADSAVVKRNRSLKPVQRLGSCRFQAQVTLESPDLGSACCVPHPPQERQQNSHEENLKAELNKRRRAIDPQSG